MDAPVVVPLGMGIKYQRRDGLREAVAARQTPYQSLERKPRLTQRGRLLIIYSGILLFCAFILVGEMYQRSVRARRDAPMTVRGIISSVDAADTTDETVVRIDLVQPVGGMNQVTTTLTEEHAGGLKQGDTVAVLLRPSGDKPPQVLEVSRFALDPVSRIE